MRPASSTLICPFFRSSTNLFTSSAENNWFTEEGKTQLGMPRHFILLHTLFLPRSVSLLFVLRGAPLLQDWFCLLPPLCPHVALPVRPPLLPIRCRTQDPQYGFERFFLTHAACFLYGHLPFFFSSLKQFTPNNCSVAI
jgi:hypothetical protein